MSSPGSNLCRRFVLFAWLAIVVAPAMGGCKTVEDFVASGAQPEKASNRPRPPLGAGY
jgi:hypothetical protein